VGDNSAFLMTLEGRGADEDTLYNLIEEVSALGGVQADRAISGTAPEGSKSLGLEALGLLVSAATSALPNLVSSIGDWLTRQPPGTKLRVKVGENEIEWEGQTPPAEVMALMTAMAGRATG